MPFLDSGGAEILAAVIPSSPRVQKTASAVVAVVVVGSAVLFASQQSNRSPGSGAATTTNHLAPVGAPSGTTVPVGLTSTNPASVGASPVPSAPHTTRPPSGVPGSSTPRPPAGAGSPTAPAGSRPTAPGGGTGTLIWSGSPSSGHSQFALVDCPRPASLTVENDLQFGPIWVFSKPAGDPQCVTHGIAVNRAQYNFRDNSTYYISWWSKLSNTTNNNADFQWTSNGPGGISQDYPFTINTHNGRATIFQSQPGSNGKTIWTSPTPLTRNTWNHYVVGIHTSDAPTGGWIELWYNGKAQKFSSGTYQYVCRTWDVNNNPMWGEYGPQNISVTDYVYAPKIGTSYVSVAS